jgi:hypothetical protein
VELIQRSNKIVFLTGAGVSTGKWSLENFILFMSTTQNQAFLLFEAMQALVEPISGTNIVPVTRSLPTF